MCNCGTWASILEKDHRKSWDSLAWPCIWFSFFSLSSLVNCVGVYSPQWLGRLKVPNYPSPYPESSRCDYQIQLEEGFSGGDYRREDFDVEPADSEGPLSWQLTCVWWVISFLPTHSESSPWRHIIWLSVPSFFLSLLLILFYFVPSVLPFSFSSFSLLIPPFWFSSSLWQEISILVLTVGMAFLGLTIETQEQCSEYHLPNWWIRTKKGMEIYRYHGDRE